MHWLGVLRKDLGSSPSGAALFQAVKAWILDPTTVVNVTPRMRAYESILQSALTSQSKIGWDHLLRGFLSRDWGDFYHPTDTTPLEVHHSRAITALAQATLAFQNFTLAIGKGRNTALHAAGSQGLDSVHAKLNLDITQMYNIQDTLSPFLRSYFVVPLENRLRQLPRQRSRWLQLAQLATAHSSALGSRQALVTTYFVYEPPRLLLQSTGHCDSIGTGTGTGSTIAVPTLLIPPDAQSTVSLDVPPGT